MDVDYWPPSSPLATPRRRAASFSVSESGSAKSELRLRGRDKRDSEIERFMRSELSYGKYSFKRVWTHFREAGWRSQNGHELSYDHYYIKPGKNVKTDREGEDFFLGERELVKYAVRMRIFGEPFEEPLGVASPSHVQEVLLSQHQPPGEDGSGVERSRRASRKRQRQRQPSRDRDSSAHRDASRSPRRQAGNLKKKTRREKEKQQQQQQQQRRGSQAGNPISLVSDASSNDLNESEADADVVASGSSQRSRRRRLSVSSSSSSGDESWTGNDDSGGSHLPEDDEDDEGDEEERESSASEDDGSSNSDEGGENDADEEDEGRLDNDLKGYDASSAVGGKFYAKRARHPSPERSHDRENIVRPRLTTSSSAISARKRPSRHDDHHARSSKSRKASRSDARKQPSKMRSAGKRSSQSPPSVSGESYFDDDDFSLGADQYGASPPRRPPTSSRSKSLQRGRSVPSTPTETFSTNATPKAIPPRRSVSVSSSRVMSASHSFLSPSSQVADNSFETNDGESAGYFDATATPSTAGDYEPPSSPVTRPLTPSPTTSNGTASSWTETPRDLSSRSSKSSELATTLLELRDVVFPQDTDEDKSGDGTTDRDKYAVLVATQRDGAMRIVLENARTREILECAFRDIKELPGNGQQMIPGKAVIEALLRCLRALPDATVVNPGTFTDSKEDTGKVKLVRSSSGATTADASSSTRVASRRVVPATLRFAFPCFDFWRCDHNFPMRRTHNSQAQVAPLLAELKAAKARLSDADEQLASVIQDRDNLKIRVETAEREREAMERALGEAEEKSRLALHELEAASVLRETQLKAQAVELEEQVRKLTAQVALRKDKTPAKASISKGGGISDTASNSSTRQTKSQRDERPNLSVTVVVESPWLFAFMPRIAEDIALRRQSAMKWDTVVTIEETHYHKHTSASSNRVCAITVLKRGTYQVNANLTHEKNVRAAIRIEPAADEGDARAALLLGPTLVQMYDNKRRISRVDRVLSLHANDRVAMVLLPNVSDTRGAASRVDGGDAPRESWPPAFRPSSNQLALTFLDSQLVYESPSSPGLDGSLANPEGGQVGK